jgi:hypothetical protein
MIPQNIIFDYTSLYLQKNAQLSTVVFLQDFFELFYPFKEKSWSVRLVPGHILDDQIRSQRCQNCKSISQILVVNHQNPNLLLYACRDSKCRHRMLRVDMVAE